MAFYLEKDQYIAIYGYTARGIDLKKILRQEGFSHLFFIDQRSVSDTDDIVMSFSEFTAAYKYCDENVILFISLQNAVEHQKIAKKLSDSGYSKIIFLPADPRCSEEASARMRGCYNNLIAGKVCLSEQIPEYREIILNPALCVENGLIEDEDVYVKVWMPTNHIFVNKAQTNIIELHREYYGKCLALVDHYQAIFTYFEKGEKSEALEKYMSAQGYVNADGSFSEDKIEDRYRLWCLYKDELNKGMSFFISSAPEVVANEQGGFNICDGLHRAIFLFMNGFSYLPVKMKKELFYQKYDNDRLDGIRELMINQGMTHTIAPIEHPAFYRFPCKAEYREMDNLIQIQKYLGTMDLSERRFLDWGRCECYYARNIRKMLEIVKAEQIVGVVSTDAEMQFVKLTLELLDIEDIQLYVESQTEPVFSDKYDIMFVMGKKFSEYRDSLRKYSENTSWLMFLECGERDFEKNTDIIMEQGGFDRYKVIRKYYAEQETKVLLALEKGDEVNP